MSFQWTAHRFSGGALALDVANSVVMRFDAERRIDRLAVSAQRAAFPAAASVHCADRDGFGVLASMDGASGERLVVLREAIDGHFRHQALNGTADNGLLSKLLGIMADIFAAHAAHEGPCPIDLATARSALSLMAAREVERLRICPNCDWLFLDRSKNRSRTWCDMAVCGNRAKARLHYARKRRRETE